ncbi:hypothetical protein B5S28_g2320 [[Candida] boidinii]|nr:hypothetical protein B5S28_g2320 [[Candida] boidinii]OWB61229.1 hypothetical protein B5S29_g2116 [[Candida] boidinii]GMF00190.1 unnamed protein product [[Candida] boidinii]
MTSGDGILKYFSEYLPRISSLSLCIEISPNEIRNIKCNRDNLKELFIFLKQAGSTAIKIELVHEIKYYTDEKLMEIIHKSTSNSTASSGNNFTSLSLEVKDNSSSGTGTKNGVAVVKSQTSDFLTSQHLKWTHDELNQMRLTFPNCKFQCFKCDFQVLNLNSTNKINCMPSEIWAEMMEYWHCHKPNDEYEHGHDHHDNQKNNRYNTNLRPSQNSIIVGPYYILLNQQDVNSININSNHVYCKNCGYDIGIVDEDSHLVKIWKYDVKLAYEDGDGDGRELEVEKFRPFLQLYEILLDSVSSTAIRHYLIQDQANDGNILNIWVFNFGVKIKLLPINSEFKDCLKIMYNKDLNFFKENNNTFDTIVVPSKVFNDFEEILKNITINLPNNLQKMSNWNVSYLPSDV